MGPRRAYETHAPAQAQVGGKGSQRRKTAPLKVTNTVDEKKLDETARKGGLQELPPFDEANILLEDESVLQVKMPKVWATMQQDFAGNTILLQGITQKTTLSKLSQDMRVPVEMRKMGGMAGMAAALAGAGAGAPDASAPEVSAPAGNFDAEDQD